MTHWIKIFVAASSALALVACSQVTPKPGDIAGELPEVVEAGSEQAAAVEAAAAAAAAEEEAARASALAAEEALKLHPLDDPSSPLAKRVIYFAFDSSTLNPEGLELIAAHAAYLADNPGVAVRLVGHADERGSREYNLGLGERRAQAVERLLLLGSVAATQLQMVSYGEESAVAFGHDEDSWWQNRRVEIVYLGR